MTTYNREFKIIILINETNRHLVEGHHTTIAFVVKIYLNNSSDINLTSKGATQPNELIYNGSIRNGRNATLVIKENGF